jgi:CyaY protein
LPISEVGNDATNNLKFVKLARLQIKVITMDESEFNQHVDDIIERIEEQLDEMETDLDYETAGGVFTVTFENNTKIIINRQAPLKQIWVATKSGGFHFDFNLQSDHWVKDDDGTELFNALSQYFSDQAGEPIELKA